MDIIENNLPEPATPIETNPLNVHKRKRGERGKADEKGKMLKELKKIWINDSNKKNEIISAATVYAELMGWKVKSQESSPNTGKGEIMKIEFINDTRKPITPPIPITNKIIEALPFTKDANETSQLALPKTENDSECKQPPVEPVEPVELNFQ